MEAVINARPEESSSLTAQVSGEYVGTVGKRMWKVLIPKKCHQFDNKYGIAWAIHFDDLFGNHYLFFSNDRRVADDIMRHINRMMGVEFTVALQSIDRGRRMNKIKFAVVKQHYCGRIRQA